MRRAQGPDPLLWVQTLLRVHTTERIGRETATRRPGCALGATGVADLRVSGRIGAVWLRPVQESGPIVSIAFVCVPPVQDLPRMQLP